MTASPSAGPPSSGPALRIGVALAATYALYAVLLNSVGTVILQSITSFGVSKTAGSVLEACKDLTIAAVSFALASSLPRLGYRRALIVGFLALAAACAAMPLLHTFWMTALSFAVAGATFGLAKVAVYGTVGLVAPEPHRHASLIALIEGVFMAGVLSGYWLFAAFIDPKAPFGWLNVYWVLAGAALAMAALWTATPLDETALRGADRRSPAAEFGRHAGAAAPAAGLRLPRLRFPVRADRAEPRHLDAHLQPRGAPALGPAQRAAHPASTPWPCARGGWGQAASCAVCRVSGR